jgi:hypothetical protein
MKPYAEKEGKEVIPFLMTCCTTFIKPKTYGELSDCRTHTTIYASWTCSSCGASMEATVGVIDAYKASE